MDTTILEDSKSAKAGEEPTAVIEGDSSSITIPLKSDEANPVTAGIGDSGSVSSIKSAGEEPTPPIASVDASSSITTPVTTTTTTTVLEDSGSEEIENPTLISSISIESVDSVITTTTTGDAEAATSRLRAFSTGDVDPVESPLEEDCDVPARFRALSVDPEVSEWRQVVDPKTGKHYYFNSRTKQTSWVLPEKSVSDSSPTSGEQAWRKVTNLKDGKPYYYNVLTRQTSWTQPAGFEESYVVASPTNRGTDGKAEEAQQSGGDDYIERIRHALLLRSPVNAKAPRLSSPGHKPAETTF